MKLDIPGLLGAISGLPTAINRGLLGPLPVNPGMGLDPSQVQQAQGQALNDLAFGMLAGNRRAPGASLFAARQNAREGFSSRVFDMLKEQEILRMRGDRDEQKKQDEMAAAQQAQIEAAMQNAPPPPGLNIPAEAWAALPAKDKVTLYGQYVPPKPQGATTVAPGGKLVNPQTGEVIYANPALPRSAPFEIVMPGAFPKSIPASVRTAVVGNEEVIRTIDKTIAEYEAYKKKHPDKAPTGPLKSGTVYVSDAMLPGNPGTSILDNIDPDGVRVRQGVADIGSMVFHDRSGAAVTLSESPRLRPFVPEGNKGMESNIENMKHLRDKAVTENSLVLKTYGMPYQELEYSGGTQETTDQTDISSNPPDETREVDGAKYVRYGADWFKVEN